MAAAVSSSTFDMPDPEAVRDAAQRVISQSKYQYDRSNLDFSDFLKWFQDALVGFVEFVGDMLGFLGIVSPAVAWIITIGLLIVAVGLIVHIAYTFASAMRGPRAAPLPGGDPTTSHRSPEQWEAEAERHASRSDYMQAARCLLRAGLARIAEARRKPFRAGATNRECLRLMRETAAFDPLRQLIEIVDSRWYGGMSCNVEDFNECDQAYGAIQEFASSRGHTQRA